MLEQAAAIVAGYHTGLTLRQLFYRLVSNDLLPNLASYYRRLSGSTAAGRRDGTFPELLDRTSRIERYPDFDSPNDALGHLRNTYRRDRTEGQEWTIIAGVEKDGISEQLDAWFTDPFGIPHVALGGFASQDLCDRVRRFVAAEGRPAVFVYAGDFDPSGEDIDRDFVARVGVFDKVVRIALNEDQIAQYGLATSIDFPQVLTADVRRKLRRDPRARAFEERHGTLVQYEVDALPPDALRNLYRSAIGLVWDDDAYREAIAQEDADRAALAAVTL